MFVWVWYVCVALCWRRGVDWRCCEGGRLQQTDACAVRGNRHSGKACTLYPDQALTACRAACCPCFPSPVTLSAPPYLRAQTFGEFLEPIAHVHFNVEGTIEFTAMLFVPGMAPFEQQNWAAKSRSIKLYVRRVFISDEFDEDLMPRWGCRGTLGFGFWAWRGVASAGVLLAGNWWGLVAKGSAVSVAPHGLCLKLHGLACARQAHSVTPSPAHCCLVPASHAIRACRPALCPPRRYLSFVKGIVDSSDLPLNVSREILQESRIVRVIRKQLIRRSLEMIEGLSKKEGGEDYKTFWENFGRNLKVCACVVVHMGRACWQGWGCGGDSIAAAVGSELCFFSCTLFRNPIFMHPVGAPPLLCDYVCAMLSCTCAGVLQVGVIEDQENRERLSKLLRFHSSKCEGDNLVGLEEYVGRMKEGQKGIYYMVRVGKGKVGGGMSGMKAGLAPACSSMVVC